jgi:hypothetical protein
MTCAPFMCNGSPKCADRQCPGHPAQLAEHSRIGVEEERPDYDYSTAEEVTTGAALAGLAAVAGIVFASGWLIYIIAPLVVASFH